MTLKSKSTFNSILQKFTGYRVKKIEHQNDFKASSSLSVSNIPENKKEKDPILKNQSSSISDERVKEDMLQQTLFPNSRRTSYFNVLKYEKKRETVIEAMEDICATVDMIEQEDELYKSEGGVAYRRNTTACFDFMKACEFYDVCSGEIKEEYLVKAESAHPELEMTKT